MYSISDVNELKTKILDNCPKCKGKGRYITPKGFVLCECIDKFRRYVDMLNANIPRSFWDLEFDQKYFTSKFVEENKRSLDIIADYLNHLSNAVKTGAGLYIWGSYGVGKSFIGCSILKKALNQKFKTYFVLLSELINLAHRALRDNEIKTFLLYIIEEVDFLLVDEIDKKYKTELIDALLDELFKKRYYSGKPFIITSNKEPKKVLEGFGKSVCEVFSERIIVVPLVGESFRPEILKDIKKELLGGEK
ncbi:MAG: ATP-binding protein [Candidatus Cloacimonetes bacterium]|nr:ATP-binding protein [Candidatus Cloacimonadota bacterium]